jgi:hypothetical protein
MKHLLCILVLVSVLALASTASAAPYLVANPENVTLAAGQTLTYNVSGLPASFTAATNIPADTTGTYAFALDLATLPAGSYTVTATACLNDPSWGVQCSASSGSFPLIKPGPPPVPTTLGLSVKQ